MEAAVGVLRPGSLFAQRYRILDEVGKGGFGVIYKAEDLDQHRRLIAIKQINLSRLSPQQMIEVTDSFNREVEYLSQLKHDHIPRVHDYFTDPEHWYVVMDYVEGETLEDRLIKARGGRFPMQKVFDIGIALCEVLGYLHAQRPPIVFRDVKPANIMLTQKGRIYLIDFGIARHYTQD
ncbi:MAG TPA: serine/threonine-protein kinase, partial [Ktedonobacteraceae bacterium]